MTAAGAALLAAGGLMLLAHLATVRQAGEWAVLPDHGGPLRHVTCIVNTARRSTLRNAALVAGIVNALPARTRVTILTNDRGSLAVVRNAQPGRVEFLDLPAEASFTIWPQDPFLVLAGRDGRRMLLASREFDRADDRLVGERLAPHLGWTLRQSRLAFEGGNLVAGARHVFIGANTVRYNAVKTETPDADVAAAFQKELGRPVIVLGPVPQPVSHIDMAVTVLDDHRLAVADPRWGATIARDEQRDRPETVTAFERACEQHYFGDPRIRELADKDGKPIRPPEVVGKTAAAADESEAIADPLDKLAENLRPLGYEILRLPFLFRARRPPPEKPGEKPAAAKGPSTRDRAEEEGFSYPCLTYNNVLTETVGEKRIVYLPQYGWKAMDAAARKAWQEAGYEVVGVEGLATSAMYGGSLRCCTKVLARDASPGREGQPKTAAP